ncbi:hypothetical protein [Cupriavidus basilensis]|uniref:hypothetical protein n=1 Tax=Cupriavidus basilensis TaxID=68895 RepID=UPI001187171D|nr:hypothetical protein [Cupriavidus basilensis]
MKSPTFAPAYLSYFPMLAEVAQKHGYALAAHGSLVSDFDLVAIPWKAEASSAEELMRAIAKYADACMDLKDGHGVPLHVRERKPHGRVSWSIQLGNGAYIDLSVMPLLATHSPSPVQSQARACGCHKCIRDKDDASGIPLALTRMVLCPTCGNKRCPRASDHDRACTGSNEPGQEGSIYPRPHFQD